MILQPLTTSEEEIMQLIWSKGEVYFRELMDIFPEPKPHQNTVSTFLKILVEKHYLTTEKHGRIYRYFPAISAENYQKFVLKKFLESYFQNSAAELLKVMMEENMLNPADLNQFFEVKTTLIPVQENIEKENPIQDFIKEITADKKGKKKEKDKKKKKKNK